jgi:C4-dicarboxylate-specific signal transduction histidine kinase
LPLSKARRAATPDRVGRDLGETIKIRVRDNGTGIPPEIREKLFQPFFTTKPTGEGTGLGLSISWNIVTQQHGGSIADFARSVIG